MRSTWQLLRASKIVQDLVDYGLDRELVKHMDVALDLLVLNNDGKTAAWLP